MSAITKAVIPAAGFGTRMLPAAKAVPKEMMPLLERPTIQYVVEEAASAGIEDVLLITSRDKRAIEDHFDRNAELEQRLAAAGKLQLLASVQALMQKVQVHSLRQAEQKGLGHAVMQARRHVGSDAFLCLLGDTIFSGEPSPAQQLIDAHQKYGGTIVGLEEVPADRVQRYGIVGGQFVADGVLKIDMLVEKPAAKDAPSRLAVAARYVMTPEIFDYLDVTQPSSSGEIQLTDALSMLVAKHPIHGVVLKARRHDIGNLADWLKANLLLARRDPALWREVESMMKELR